LRRIHFHIANAYTEDSCQATHCLPHQKFAMTVFDQVKPIFPFQSVIKFISLIINSIDIGK